MNQRTTIGPRGWAILTLAGGAALASPFLRPAQLKTHDDFATSAHPTPASHLASFSQLALPTTDRNETMSDSTTLFDHGAVSPASLPAQGTLPVPRVPTFSAAAPAAAVGQTAVELPAWAEKKSKLDALITSGKAGSAAPALSTQADSQFLEPLKPWQNERPNQDLPSADSQDPALASSRFSPWQNADAIETASAATSLAQTNWAVDPAADIRAMVLENTPKPQVKPGGLVGATLQRTTEPASEPASSAPPKFVFQPGMKSE